MSGFWHFYGNTVVITASAIGLNELNRTHSVFIWEDSDLRGKNHNIKELLEKEVLAAADALLCVHGRRILPKRVLDRYLMGGYNVHPYLREYPGADPIGRALADGNREASVCAHKMSERVDDSSHIVAEEHITIPPERFVSRRSVYEVLYPLYRRVVRETVARVDEQAEVMRQLVER